MDEGRNLILVTLDGVRRKEFADRECFTFLHSEKKGMGWNAQASHPSLTSLPCYQTLLTGNLARGAHNDLPPIQSPSILDHIQAQWNLEHRKVAAFASWEKLARAVSHRTGSFYVDVASEEKEKPPWPECRWDRHTFQRAMEYLRVHEPRFLYLSLADTDDWAHTQSFERYRSAIQECDAYLENLIGWLSTMGSYGDRTLVLVTTDHGRGEGANWHDHGPHTPEAKKIWMYGWKKSGFKAPARETSHLDLFPAIESYFSRSSINF